MRRYGMTICQTDGRRDGQQIKHTFAEEDHWNNTVAHRLISRLFLGPIHQFQSSYSPPRWNLCPQQTSSQYSTICHCGVYAPPYVFSNPPPCAIMITAHRNTNASQPAKVTIIIHLCGINLASVNHLHEERVSRQGPLRTVHVGGTLAVPPCPLAQDILIHGHTTEWLRLGMGPFYRL